MPRRRLLLVVTSLAITTLAAAQAPSWRWDKDDLEGWRGDNFQSLEVRDGMLRGVTRYDPMLTSPPLSLDASRYKVIEFRVQSSLSGGGEIFWHAAGQGFSEERMSRHALLGSGQPRVYRVDLSAYPTWQGIVTGLRLDLLNPAGATVALDYVRFLDRDLGAAPNPGFEDDFDGDGRPDGWSAQAAEFGCSDRHATEGTRSALVATGERREATLGTRVPLDGLGLYRLEGDVSLEGAPGEARARLRFLDVFGKPLAAPEVVVAAGAGKLAGQFTAPAGAAAADLALTIAGPGRRAWWDAVVLTHVAEQPDASVAPFETWQASWIWAEATAARPKASAYLRRSFELPVSPAQVSQAKLQVTADDAYELFLNGRSLVQKADPDGWRTPEVLDLRPYLQAGRNVLAVQARNVGSASGFLLEGGLRWPGGGLTLLSDGGWRAAGEAPAGWEEADYADGAWPAAKVIAAAGRDPWGYLPYEYLGAREPVKLLQSRLPAEVAAGEEISVAATLARLPAAAAGFPLRLAILQDDAIVYGRVCPAPRPAAAGKPVVLGPFTVRLTRFLKPGRYQVALGFPYTEYRPGEGLVLGTVRVRPPARAEARPRVEIRRQGGLPTLLINGKPASFMHYLELNVGADRITNMADHGLHLYELCADDIGWKAAGRFDYAAWDRKVLQLLMYDPQALIMPTFDVSGLEQRWWLEGQDDELARTASGSTDIGIYGSAGKIVSLASLKWRQASGEAVSRFVRHCQQAPYGTRVIGYQPCSGVSWEWQHWGSVGAFEPGDYSDPMQAAFRAWVRKTYDGDVQRLRAAWRQPQLELDAVRIPSVEERDGPRDRVFRDPRQHQYVIDFYKFFQDVMVDGIEHYFRLVKEASNHQTIVGTYYGYELTMLSGARRAGDAGHFALRRLLQSKYCDFLMSPLDYSNRDVGDSYTVMSPIGSVLAHDKLWVLQDDLRTHLVADATQRAHGAPDSLAGTVSQLQRGYAIATAKGATTQWYDFSNGWIARDRRQGAVIQKLHDLDRQWVRGSDRGPDPESVAVIVDEESPAAYMSHAFEINYWAVYRQKAVFERLGAPFNFYLLKDVVSGKLPKFRCYFFLNCYKLSDGDRAWIANNLQRDSRTLVWLYAPGYVNDTSLDAARLGELTGMAFTQRDEPRPWRVSLDPAAAPAVSDWTQPNFSVSPSFVPGGADLQVLGFWEGSRDPALAVRSFPTWTSVYSATPLLSPTLVKRLVARSGVPVTVESTEPSYVGNGLIGLHSAAARSEHLHFASPTVVRDALTGAVLGRGVRELEVKLGGPETRLLRVAAARS